MNNTTPSSGGRCRILRHYHGRLAGSDYGYWPRRSRRQVSDPSSGL